MRDIIVEINDIKSNFPWIEKGTSMKPWVKGRVHSTLALQFFELGMTYIKNSQIPLAKGAFQYSVDTQYWLFEKYFSTKDFTPNEFKNLDDYENQVVIAPGLLAAIAWQELFLALLLNQPEKLIRFNELYKIAVNRRWAMYEHASNSRFIGLLASSLISHDLPAAQYILEKKQPSIGPRLSGISDCLVALAREDQEGFLLSMKKSEVCWKKVCKGEEKDMPYSACHIFGACLFKLSERIFHKQMHNDYLLKNKSLCFPAQLLDDNLPIEYPFTMPEFVFR